MDTEEREPEPVKERLQRALMELCETRDINDVSVKELIARAGVARQSFYYHFADVNDLISYTASMPGLGEDYRIFSADALREMLAYQVKHRGFFSQLPHHRGQNAVRKTFKRWMKSCARELDTEGADAAGESAPADACYRQLRCDLYCNGAVDLILDWEASGMEAPIGALVAAIIDATPDFLRESTWGATPAAESYPK